MAHRPAASAASDAPFQIPFKKGVAHATPALRRERVGVGRYGFVAGRAAQGTWPRRAVAARRKRAAMRQARPCRSQRRRAKGREGGALPNPCNERKCQRRIGAGRPARRAAWQRGGIKVSLSGAVPYTAGSGGRRSGVPGGPVGAQGAMAPVAGPRTPPRSRQ
jgi:hypothetical protein